LLLLLFSEDSHARKVQPGFLSLTLPYHTYHVSTRAYADTPYTYICMCNGRRLHFRLTH
jgi:hypothetical protein